MPTTKWCHNAKTGEIFDYREEGEWNDFPRGTFLCYQDYLTTGLKSRQEAEDWAKKYGACPKCKEARPANKKKNCKFCGTKIEFVKKGGDA